MFGKEKERAFSLQLSFFLENGRLFCAHTKSPNTISIGVSAGARENPQMALLVSRVSFWEGAPKGGFTICDT